MVFRRPEGRPILSRLRVGIGPTGLWVLAMDTWRLAWREVMTRVELALLVILAVVSGFAAIGSPRAGDGAIQMLAFCLQVVPFSLVLVAGQIWRSSADEVALWSRPLTALIYVSGRALGLLLVGLVMLSMVDVAGSLMLGIVAHLNLLSGLGWDTYFSLVLVAPSLLLVVGGCLGLIAVTGGGARYYTWAISLSLLVAFVQYKLGYLALAIDPHWSVWSPFPGLLTLGLALPPALLRTTLGWIVANRVFYAILGMGILALTVYHRAKGRETPMANLRPVRWSLGVAVGLGMLALWSLEAQAARIAPTALSPADVQKAAATTMRLDPGGHLHIRVALDASKGQIRGQAHLNDAITGSSDVLDFWLNHGLQVTGVLVNGHTEPASLVRGGALDPNTAASLWQISLGALPTPTVNLQVDWRGRLLPVPTLLPTAPFGLGQAYEGLYLAPRRLFLDGRGTWYPQFLAPGAGGAPIDLQDVLTLRIASTGSGVSVATSLAPNPNRGTYGWSGAGPLPSILWLAAPYSSTVDQGISIWTRRPFSGSTAAVYGLYANALRTLMGWLPPEASGSVPMMVASPIDAHPLLAGGILTVPENQPFCIPADPIVGTCNSAAPSPESAMLEVSLLGWKTALGLSGGNLPGWQPQLAAGDQRTQMAPVLAAVTVWRATTGSEATALAAAWAHGSTLPVLGRLSSGQIRMARELASWSRSISSRTWRRFAARVQKAAAGPHLTWTRVQQLQKS